MEIGEMRLYTNKEKLLIIPDTGGRGSPTQCEKWELGNLGKRPHDLQK